MEWLLRQFGRTGVRLPEEGPQRTALRAILAGGLLLLLLAVIARSCSAPVATFQMERYVKLGPRQGAATLERELLAMHGPGTSLGGLLSRVTRMGFRCEFGLPEEPNACRFRALRGDGQIATISVEIRHDGTLVEAVAVRMDLGPR